ncbi:hypothetical protein [Paenibacillus periandrae]|uniref:hypothetical protein n=1 Tax=Paenibacillus periandrae TaxID=1761741 RepID=UPI001F0974FE|nr:hypothetical protein [Paenibacillus periandrae]
MEIVKERTLNEGDVVQIYKNLNRDCFSVKNKTSGLVVAYVQTATIRIAKFHVSKKGRQRVLDKKVRSVHAWVEGFFVAGESEKPSSVTFHTGYYNPYKVDTFINEHTRKTVLTAELAYFANDRVYYADVSQSAANPIERQLEWGILL